MQFKNLTEILAQRKQELHKGITFIDGYDQEEFLSYGELYFSALKVLSYLQNKGLQPTDELVFQIENNKTFIIVFWACILGGIIPVPLSIGQNDDHRQKLFNVWAILNNPHLVISQGNLGKLRAYAGLKQSESLFAEIEKHIVDEGALLSSSIDGVIFPVKENAIAFIQFSSGSTGYPKGVILTHNNLLANMEGISNAAVYSPGDSTLSWMPLTHDMGLIGFHLSPLFNGMNQYLVPTGLFIRMPALWIAKASEHKITILSSPNFGYKYFGKHCAASETYDWDLSAVRIIYNGAEPIAEKLCYDFLDSMAKYKLKRNAMCPVYGLAEASVAVSISGMQDEVVAVQLHRNQLNLLDKIAIQPGAANTVSFINVGKAIDHTEIRIADNDDIPVDCEIIGHIQIRGANVTSGYYNNEEETRKVSTKDGWLKTGDLGFIKNDSLYITGRAKDIIFLNGQNYYPHDIERVAEGIEGIELNKIAVAGFFNNELQKEETVAFIFYRDSLEKFISLAKSLQALINLEMGFKLDKILPVKDIPRTTSGKLQRFRLLEQYRSGGFNELELELHRAMVDLGVVIAEPVNDVEQKLLLIWQKVLGTTGFGITHNFFEVGGNSLKAAEVAMMLVKECNVSIPVEQVYEKPTIREFAISMTTAIPQQYIPIPLIHESEYYPVSSAQKRLYYAWQVDRSSVAYNIPVAFCLEGELDSPKLEACLKQLIQRHDALRMSFYMNPEPVFKIHPFIDFTLDCLECREDEINETLKGLVRPFNLAKTPLFRIHLLKVTAGRYLLFTDFHHIIADGLSIYNFINELLVSYHDKVLPVLRVQFKDYTSWETESVSLERSQLLKQYWQSKLQDELPLLDMPLDFTRPVLFNTAGEKIEFELSKETTQQLYQFATANKCTLHILLFTIYNILLLKYTGQNSIVTGIPVAGRRHPDLQNSFGMFVNNLAIKTTMEGDPAFTQLLEFVKATLHEALYNQDYPFEKVIQLLNDRRDVGRNFIFDTMFIYQNMGLPAIKDSSILVSRYFFDPGFSKYDISLEVFEDRECIRYAFEYAVKLFAKETIVQIAIHFNSLINAILCSPQSRISELQIITPHEQEAFIGSFNETVHVYPPVTIHRLFEQQVLATPANIAIDHEGKTMTYEELNSKANDLALLLREKGMVRETVCCILLDKSPDLVVSILGVLKAGGCYLPIDTDLPEKRIRYILEDSKSAFLITDEKHTVQWRDNKDIARQVYIINIHRQSLRSAMVADIPGVNDPRDLAYIIYTSGTTGQPKGVMIEHHSLVNYITWAADKYSKNGKASFPLFTSISFDLTITSIFTPLITGSAIVIYEEDGKHLLLERIIKDNKVNCVKLTPSHLKILAESKLPVPETATRLKSIIVGGEQLETRLAKVIANQFHDTVDIYNEYGPTEATVGCMIHVFDPHDHSANVPIGIPAQNTNIYVLDKFLQPVPAKVQGELYISGDGIARGYLYKEELTSQQFIPDPFRKGQRMYKTGDIARRLATGIIEYAGRYDQQVKINGYRIELAEIESHMLSYAGVTDALVMVKTNEKKQKTIIAYYKSNAPVDEGTWRNYLSGRLPHYMMPVSFTRLMAIPLTQNGKVDYESLPEPETRSIRKQRVLPANKTEEVTVNVWEEVLGVPGISVTDNFFELGGDSIKAVQITSKLYQYAISLQVKHILTFHTIQQICRYAVPAEVAAVYEQQVMEGQKNLSPVEKWFFNRKFKNPHYYNQSVLLTLNRNADRHLLEKAFQLLVEHHDGLRMNYDAEKNRMFYNNDHLTSGFILDEITVDSAPGRSLFDQLKSTFDITGNLLLKTVLLKERNARAFLFITAHHLVIDGISWRILLEDLYTIYNALEKVTTVQLPPKTASLIDWNRKLVEFSGNYLPGSEAAYWIDIENTPFHIPQDMETNDWKVENLQKVWGILDEQKTASLLKEMQSIYKTDAQILLITALAQTLKEWTGTGRIVIELEHHGRNLDAINVSRTIGWFTIMYPLRLQLVEDSPGNQLKAVKQQVRNVPRQGMGYDFYTQQNKLPAIRFNYLGQFADELNNDLFSYSREPHGNDIAPENNMTAGLDFTIMVIGGTMRLEISYNQKAYRESTITWCRDTFLKNLAALIEPVNNGNDIHFVPADFDSVELDEGDLKVLFE